MASASWSVGFDESRAINECYGEPISADEALRQFGRNRAASTISVLVFAGEVEVRRKRILPQASERDFFSSIVSNDGRYFFSGFLNGWPGLSLLELASVEEFKGLKKTGRIYWSAEGAHQKQYSGIQKLVRSISGHFDRVHSAIEQETEPSFPEGAKVCLVRLFRPEWADEGYGEGVPGYIWYYTGGAKDSEFRRIAYGDRVMDAARSFDEEGLGEESLAFKVHHFGHRYAKEKESAKDKMVYHTGVFIEWNHGEYGTVVELAWLHGLGGYNGRSNWVEDKDEEVSELYSKMPAEMKQPFITNRSEVRCIDVPARNIEEFSEYLERFTGNRARFLDAKIKSSAKVAILGRTKSEIFGAAYNRIRNNPAYSEPSVTQVSVGFNCQTFAASFFGYLANQPARMFLLGLPVLSRTELYSTDPETGDFVEPKYSGKQSKGNRKKSANE